MAPWSVDDTQLRFVSLDLSFDLIADFDQFIVRDKDAQWPKRGARSGSLSHSASQIINARVVTHGPNTR
jgi:hypothetical protein